MMLKYVVIFEKTKTGYSAYVPDIPVCLVTAKTRSLVEKKFLDTIRFHLEGMKEEKIKFPLNRTDAETFVFAV